MYKLYDNKASRAARVRWMLEEVGAPYELVRLEMADLDTPGYRRIYPLGCLPALEEDGERMIESVAMCAHLADKFPEKGLAPAPGTRERALYYQWLFFGVAELERALGDMFEAGQLPEGPESEKALAAARAEYAERAAVLKRELAAKEWLLGNRFSAADVVIGSMLVWAKFMGLLDGFPNLEAYVKRCGAHEANRRSRAN